MTIRPLETTIKRCALDILNEHGPGGLTVRAVATAAGTSTTGIYTYFGGKQGLLDALFTDAFESFTAYVWDVTDHDPYRALEEGFARYRTWALEHAAEYLHIFASRASGYSPGLAAGLTASASFDALVAHVSAAWVGPSQGRRSGATSAGEAAGHVWAVAHGLMMLEIAGHVPSIGGEADRYAAGVASALAAWVPRVTANSES